MQNKLGEKKKAKHMMGTKPFVFWPGIFNCALLTLLIVGLMGCATDRAKQIQNFSSAAILTGENAKKAFKLVEDSHFNEELSVEVLHFDDNDDPGFHPDHIQPFIGTDALQARLAILDGLQTYAANLSVLMGNSALTNFDQETTKLGQTLRNINTDLVKDSFFKQTQVTPQQLQIFTTAINALGHWLITYKEQKEAKKAIGAMQQPVSDICQLLQKDFAILGQQLENDYSQTLKNNNQYILNNGKGFSQSPGEKRTAVRDLALLTQDMHDKKALFVSMQSSVGKLQAAHAALGQVFSQNNSNVVSLIDELSSEARRISKYYSSLKNAY